MLRKVSFSNFYSFEKKQEIGFLAKKKTSYSYANTISGDQITEIASVIGANASGKTNVMRFFSFISYFVCMSNKNESASLNNIPFNTFYNNNKVSDFYVEYESNNKIYFYSLSIKENIVLKEALMFKTKVKNAKNAGYLCEKGTK